jgi:bifunctional pyridoxal-dependent enzyme with beta-cystathionase and maltose regulon repressor activities
MENMIKIPNEITNAVIEINTQQNDGYTMKHYREYLEAVRDYINKALEKSSQ